MPLEQAAPGWEETQRTAKFDYLPPNNNNKNYIPLLTRQNPTLQGARELVQRLSTKYDLHTHQE